MPLLADTHESKPRPILFFCEITRIVCGHTHTHTHATYTPPPTTPTTFHCPSRSSERMARDGVGGGADVECVVRVCVRATTRALSYRDGVVGLGAASRASTNTHKWPDLATPTRSARSTPTEFAGLARVAWQPCWPCPSTLPPACGMAVRRATAQTMTKKDNFRV